MESLQLDAVQKYLHMYIRKVVAEINYLTNVLQLGKYWPNK